MVFSDSTKNKLELADEHLSAGNYERAEFLYESCLKGIYKDDSNLLMKLVKVNYHKKDYDKVIEYGSQISEKVIFNKSEEKVALAWAYYAKDRKEEAKQLFEEMDTRFSNYTQRFEFSKFLVETNVSEAAKKQLETLMSEISTMNNYEKKLNRTIYRTIKNYHAQLSKSK